MHYIAQDRDQARTISLQRGLRIHAWTIIATVATHDVQPHAQFLFMLIMWLLRVTTFCRTSQQNYKVLAMNVWQTLTSQKELGYQAVDTFRKDARQRPKLATTDLEASMSSIRVTIHVKSMRVGLPCAIYSCMSDTKAVNVRRLT